MICYVDTAVVIWLAQAQVAKLSQKAISLVQIADVRISLMVLLELQYLHEVQRISVKPQDVLVKLSTEIGLTMCDHPFPVVAQVALGETWTRDPFDRIIVAHARANGVSPLLTKDELMLNNYS